MKTNSSDSSFYATQYRHVRQCGREAWIAVGCWFLGLVYCTAVFVTMGYIPPEQRPAEPPLVLGIPAWVFWGLFAPWLVQIGITWWFALRVLKDDEPYSEFPAHHADGPQRTGDGREHEEAGRASGDER